MRKGDKVQNEKNDCGEFVRGELSRMLLAHLHDMKPMLQLMLDAGREGFDKIGCKPVITMEDEK